MKTTDLIIHRLTRTVGEQSFRLSDQIQPNSERQSGLMNELKSLYTRRSAKRYGRFSDEPSAFKTLVMNWQAQPSDFVQFSQQVLEQLAMLLEERKLESDGYWLFVRETLPEQTLCWIAQLKQRPGLEIDDDNALGESQQIDFAKTGLCLRLDLTQLESASSETYLTLTFGFGERPMQAALTEFIGFQETVNAKADTRQFMETVQAFSATLPEESGRSFAQEAAEFCMEQSSHGEPVSLHTLSEVATTVPEGDFSDFVAEHAPEIKESFIPDPASLKKYIRYTGRSKGVSISFTNDSLGKTVSYNPDTETLTITELPATLIRQLKGER